MQSEHLPLPRTVVWFDRKTCVIHSDKQKKLQPEAALTTPCNHNTRPRQKKQMIQKARPKIVPAAHRGGENAQLV